VEPNPDCARHIERTTSLESVEVLQAAVSNRNGEAVLKVSDRKDKMSSLSDEWRSAVARENSDYEGMWNREVAVPTITLDAMIERYGLPYYVKIDVEGHEEQALQGLSKLPELVSFEFNRVFFDCALKALGNKIFADALFNYTLIDPCRFELPDWVGRDELAEQICTLPRDGPGLGDIFARKAMRQE